MSGNNILLAPLVEQTLPATVSMFPETIGWKVLLVIFIITFAYFLYKKIDKWKKNRYRRDAIKQLNELSSQSKVEVLQQLNRILKETASTAFGEKQVARLYGNDWLAFLDNTSANNFNSQETKQWQQAIYEPRSSEQIGEENIQQLIALSRLWVQQHEVSL